MSEVPETPGGSHGVRLEGVGKSYGDVHAVRDVDLDVQRGEFFSLLGPSGCGKTTLLRLIAGFEKPDHGRILIAGADVTDSTPQRRPTAMVFQNYALFPTMTVGQNVAYGLQVRGLKRGDRSRLVSELLARVDLPGLENRPVTLLSGGQQQRVALARALAVEPDVLLFDEPLSNLDVALREQTRRELKMLQNRLGTTSVYVTHDQQEALALSDRIGVMRSGKLLQIDTPRTLFEEPATAFVAQFLGWNVVTDPNLARALTGETPPNGAALGIRPENLQPSTDGVAGRVAGMQFLGMIAEWAVFFDDREFRAWLNPELHVPERTSFIARRYRWLENDLHPGTDVS